MNTAILSNPVITVQQPNVDFILGDKGSAFVSLTLFITDSSGIIHKLAHDEHCTGRLTKSLPLDRGSYSCTFVIHAFRQGVLGSACECFLNISGNEAVTAKGSIPDGSDDDLGYAKFKLIVA